MLVRITENFYQLDNVFSPDLYQRLVYSFNQDRSAWDQIADDNTDVKRQQLSLSINEYIGQQINKELRKYVRIFEPRVGVKDGKHDYTRFTPGLERMFAPTYPIKSWF